MIAMAVSKGKWQVRRVDYNKKGVSTITPLTNWISKKAAYIVFECLGGVPYKFEEAGV